ncbi:hypothetical protein WJX72_006130 [[Myrmecia] bisecta]|uniref:Uncharacterized protein n=1 Tax=[Myrmecia] bisecta TaxID=41462 RepID=A0AAW1PX45_9CHLO
MAAPLGTTGSLQRAVPPSSFQSNTGSVAHSTGPRESQRDSKPPSYFIPAKSAGQPAIRVRGKYGGIDARRPPEIAHILDSVQRRFGGQPGDPPEAGGLAFSTAATNLSPQVSPGRGASCISWQGVVRAPAANEQGYADLFNLVAALPPATAASLPTELVISGFRPRADIPMSTATDKPLMLHLGPMTEAQHNALTALEALKMAALVLLPDYDLALIPHSNARNLLHVVGLKMQKNAPGKLQPLPATLLAGCLPAR